MTFWVACRAEKGHRTGASRAPGPHVLETHSRVLKVAPGSTHANRATDKRLRAARRIRMRTRIAVHIYARRQNDMAEDSWFIPPQTGGASGDQPRKRNSGLCDDANDKTFDAIEAMMGRVGDNISVERNTAEALAMNRWATEKDETEPSEKVMKVPSIEDLQDLNYCPRARLPSVRKI